MALTRSIGYNAFPRNPAYSVGKQLRTVPFKVVFPGTGNIGDQYILAGPLTGDMRIARIVCNTMPALTSVTGANLGFYKSSDYGATQAGLSVVKTGGGNELWSAVSLATAATVYNDQLTLKNSGLDNTKAIRDLLSLGPDAFPSGGVYLVLTLPQANSAGGTWDADVIVEEATTR